MAPNTAIELPQETPGPSPRFPERASFDGEGKLRYFKQRQIEKTGLRSTSDARWSQLTGCLIFRGRSNPVTAAPNS
jgi:hypothetical protein